MSLVWRTYHQCTSTGIFRLSNSDPYTSGARGVHPVKSTCCWIGDPNLLDNKRRRRLSRACHRVRCRHLESNRGCARGQRSGAAVHDADEAIEATAVGSVVGCRVRLLGLVAMYRVPSRARSRLTVPVDGGQALWVCALTCRPRACEVKVG